MEHVCDDGSVRIHPIGDSIVRIERSRPAGGFCDDPSFTVLDRPDGDLLLTVNERGEIECSTDGGKSVVATIRADMDARRADRFIHSLEVRVDGVRAWAAADDPALAAAPPQADRLPRPTEALDVWVLHDMPRVIPPEWGALPPPAGHDGADSGWRIEADAFDVYLFLYQGDVERLRTAMIALTGEIPVPPLWTFGLWTSRYYPYSERTALDLIDRYRELDIPLDVFVVDTDWRVGASRGYEVNTELFPDMARFLAACRDRGVRTMFNDHPEPKGYAPLDARLFEYRREGLTKLLDMGLTAWWFDRNWGDIIQGPAPGLETAVWGQKLYVDIHSAHRPEERPVILSMTTEHPAAHRYPIWWTGDNFSDWQALREAVRDTIADGYQLRPYTSCDIGGHVGFPSPEQYIRWVQWASVCPTFRLHCGPKNRYRYPWRFGDTALDLTRSYVKMRYRLLPYLYSLAHHAWKSGTPLLRGLDEGPQSVRDGQFLLGESLLFAPITRSNNPEPAAASLPHRFRRPLRRQVWTAEQLDGTGYNTMKLPDAQPSEVGFDTEIRINSFNGSELSVRWGGKYFVLWDGFFNATEAGWYRFRLIGNGRKELRVDGAEQPQIRSIFDGGTVEAVLELTEGEHPVEISFGHLGGGLPVIECAITSVEETRLSKGDDSRRPSEKGEVPVQAVALPAGTWRSLRDGHIESGPTTTAAPAGIDELPAFVRCGSVLPLAPVAARTESAFWSELTLEVFPQADEGSSVQTIVFDDGVSQGYLRGEYWTMAVALSRSGRTIRLEIADLERGAATGAAANPGAQANPSGDLPPLEPAITVRVHTLPGERPSGATVGGRKRGLRFLSGTTGRRTPVGLSDEEPMFEKGTTAVLRDLSPDTVVEIQIASQRSAAD